MASKKATVKQKPTNIGGGIKTLAKSAVSKVFGGSSKAGGSRKRRRQGPAYWANKVLVMKLKRKYNKLRFSGV